MGITSSLKVPVALLTLASIGIFCIMIGGRSTVEATWRYADRCLIIETPTPQPTAIPATPTPKYTPAPTLQPTGEPAPTNIPEPTATPGATLTPVPKPSEAPKQNDTPKINLPPVCDDGDTASVVANAHVVRGVNGDFSRAIVNFFITEGDSANVYWSEVGRPHWEHSSAGQYPGGIKHNADKYISYQVNDLKPGAGYDFGIEQKKGCAGGRVTAVIVDGAESMTFRVTYYE